MSPRARSGEVPAIPDHKRIDAALRERATRLATDYLDFVDHAADAVKLEVWTHFGFPHAREYFEQRVQVSYRTVMRWLTIHSALGRLAPAEQAEARAVVATIGSHKASVIAPMFGRHGDWRDWTHLARELSEADLQAHVSEVTGALPRGRTAAPKPGHDFFQTLMRYVPPDVEEHVRAVFEALMRFGDIGNPLVAFLVMVDMAARDLEASGQRIGLDSDEPSG